MFSPDLAVILYRGPFLVTLYLTLLSINLAVWTRFKINYIRIFELKPGRRLRPIDLLRLSSLLWILWIICSLGTFLHDMLPSTPFTSPFTSPLVYPLLLFSLLILYLVNPLDMAFRSARFWLLRILWRILGAPMYHVAFADFWLGDQLVSMGQVLKDLEFTSCFYFNMFRDGVSTVADTTSCGSSVYLLIAGGLPSWFRAAQCLRRYRDTKQAMPHLANALKYSFGIIDVVLLYLNAYYWSHSSYDYVYLVYLCNKLVQTVYSYYWDIVMDWGLVKFKCGFPVWSRQKMLYNHRCVYFLAMLEDLVLRFTWLYVIMIQQYLPGLLPTQTLATLAAILEIVRRIIWNLFRVENEHVNNCGDFREQRDIPLLEPEEITQLNMTYSCKNLKKRLRSHDKGDDSDESRPLVKSKTCPDLKSLKTVKCYNSTGTTQHAFTANPFAANNIIQVV